MLKLELEEVPHRSSLSRGLFRPKAPALQQERYAGRVIPESVMPHVKGRTSVFSSPHGWLLFVPQRKIPSFHDLRFMPVGADAPIALKTGRSLWPFPHAWSPDGSRLYLGAQSELYEIGFPDLGVRLVERASKIYSVATTDGLYATIDENHVTVRAMEDDAILLQESASGGNVAFVHEGRFFYTVFPGGIGAFYAVRDREFRRVYCTSYASDQLWGDCWEEGGEVWLNQSLHSERSPKVVSKSYRVCNLDAFYPEEWR